MSNRVFAATSYTAEDVKYAVDVMDDYIEKSGDDVAAFLQNEFGCSNAVIKEAMQTLIVRYGGYKKLVLTYKERAGIDITASMKKVLGNLESRGGNLSKMSVLSIEEQLYIGKEIKPEPAIMDGGYRLVKTKDYNITYANNKNIGQATIIFKGKGKYSGEIKKIFTIVAVKKSDIPTVYLDTPEMVGNSTFLTWRVSSGKNYDGVQVLRSDSLKGKYTVIKTLQGKNTNAGYIDKETKKKGYYYAVRVYVVLEGKTWIGDENNYRLAISTKNDWYSNGEKYVKAWKEYNDQLRFIVYDSNLDIEWNCDWPNNYEEQEISFILDNGGSDKSSNLKVNYVLSTPYEYSEKGQNIEVMVYYGKKDFYYIWKDGEKGGFVASFKAIQ